MKSQSENNLLERLEAHKKHVQEYLIRQQYKDYDNERHNPPKTEIKIKKRRSY